MIKQGNLTDIALCARGMQSVKNALYGNAEFSICVCARWTASAKHSGACACMTIASDVMSADMTAHEIGADSLPAPLGSLHKKALANTDQLLDLWSCNLTLLRNEISSVSDPPQVGWHTL